MGCIAAGLDGDWGCLVSATKSLEDASPPLPRSGWSPRGTQGRRYWRSLLPHCSPSRLPHHPHRWTGGEDRGRQHRCQSSRFL